MCLLKSSYAACRIGVLPAIPHLARLRRPAIHPPRARDDGVGIACTYLKGAERPDKRIDKVGSSRALLPYEREGSHDHEVRG